MRVCIYIKGGVYVAYGAGLVVGVGGFGIIPLSFFYCARLLGWGYVACFLFLLWDDDDDDDCVVGTGLGFGG
jgi:hypothetical protein